MVVDTLCKMTLLHSIILAKLHNHTPTELCTGQCSCSIDTVDMPACQFEEEGGGSDSSGQSDGSGRSGSSKGKRKRQRSSSNGSAELLMEVEGDEPAKLMTMLPVSYMLCVSVQLCVRAAARSTTHCCCHI